MVGRRRASVLKRIRLKVPIVMVSGYRPILDEAVGKIDRWLVKGQSEPEELLSTIEELLKMMGPIHEIA